MRKIFVSSERLRAGGWAVVFVVFFLISRVLYRPLTQPFKELGLPEPWFNPTAHFLFALLVTWACTRLRKEPLASVGFLLDRRWLKEVLVGALIGMGQILTAVGLMALLGGVRFELDPGRSAILLGGGFVGFLLVALFEETLFRGFFFQRLVDSLGIWPTQLGLAFLFALAHWTNPGMEGSTRTWATVDIALGAVLYGLAYLRTRSLALPIGLHLGWNWMQGHVLGFGVSGLDQAGWLRPILQGKAEWLTGGSFGPEASAVAVIVDLVLIALVWKWKGSVAAPDREPAAAATAGAASPGRAPAALIQS